MAQGLNGANHLRKGLGGQRAQRKEILTYRVIFSRRRSISLIVSPDKGVTVRAPYTTSLRSIEKFVKEKEGWIRKHLEKHSGLTRLNHGKKYTDGELHLFLGKELCLRIIESAKFFVRNDDSIIEVGLDETCNTMKIRYFLERWYRQKAQEYLASRFEMIINSNLQYRFLPSGFSVKPIKSRWGSCSSKGTVTISSELIKLDPVFADYVIIHELCHLKHHNHGREFYRLLEEIVPDYKVVRKKLKQYITK
ncbi:MAG: M48 family metallopeptidase [Bacteroidales bacterium]|jgi:hypothetical protein|nr:M48 family metallopeptidase [Bacteroidales bacterium]